MNRLRNRLILVFLAATLAPLAVTVWITNTLLEWSRNFSPTSQLESTAQLLEQTGQKSLEHVFNKLTATENLLARAEEFARVLAAE